MEFNLIFNKFTFFPLIVFTTINIIMQSSAVHGKILLGSIISNNHKLYRQLAAKRLLIIVF